jgi:hypothetical protein
MEKELVSPEKFDVIRNRETSPADKFLSTQFNFIQIVICIWLE